MYLYILCPNRSTRLMICCMHPHDMSHECFIFIHRHLSVITRSSKYNYQFLQFKLSMSNRLKSAGTFRGYRQRGRSRCPETERDKYGGKNHARQGCTQTQHAFVFLNNWVWNDDRHHQRFEIFYRVGNPNTYWKFNLQDKKTKSMKVITIAAININNVCFKYIHCNTTNVVGNWLLTCINKFVEIKKL